jgi:hypothetical protein
VAKKVFEKIPIQVKPGEVVMDGKSFKADNALLAAIYPNPFNGERYVAIVAGTSGGAVTFFDPRRQDLFQYDYFINDGKLPNYSAGATNEKILVASGFFNADWKLDDATMTVGDGALRSKCAYTVVNKDLSTDIVSVSKPSLELLRSYEGTYQIVNGPQVTITLRGDTLMAVQGQFAARMLAVSENEFYVKEVNVSLAFEKDATTNDVVMTGHQNGQEFTSKKVK